jgi:adenylate cyclase, class 2
MQQEIEAKFLNIDIATMRDKLKKAGATLEHPMRLMRRVVVDYQDRRLQKEGSAWVRVRDEGDKVTLTYKTSIENKFGGASEIEVTVSDYEKTIAIFKAIGLKIHTNQETRRETWKLDGAEVVIDEWPWLNPFIEIEAPSENVVKSVAKKLGFDWKDAVFGSVTTAYRLQYQDITADERISVIPEIKFNLPVPDWFTNK